MTELASGALPSLRQIRARMRVGQDRAQQIRDHLETFCKQSETVRNPPIS